MKPKMFPQRVEKFGVGTTSYSPIHDVVQGLTFGLHATGLSHCFRNRKNLAVVSAGIVTGFVVPLIEFVQLAGESDQAS